MIIAIQGEKGSFHDQAARRFFVQQKFSIKPLPTFRSVFESLVNHEADFGIAAVENSLYGSIHETYDQLIKQDLVIIGEVQLLVHQSLITQPGVKLDDITEVLSHPAALDQCRSWLEANLPHAQIIEHSDTAGAVAEIARGAELNRAAIASSHAAKIYDMHTLRSNIEDEPGNITRFIVLSRSPEPSSKANKASLILTTNHQPGALYLALKIFYEHQANLTKLESRQVRGEPYRYKFVAECMADQKQLVSIIHQLQQQNCEVKLLGHYRAAELTP